MLSSVLRSIVAALGKTNPKLAASRKVVERSAYKSPIEVGLRATKYPVQEFHRTFISTFELFSSLSDSVLIQF